MSDRAELRNPLYRNWVRAALGLKYLQQGLAGFVSNLSDQRHHSHLYSYRKVTGFPAHSCSECTADNLLPEHPRKNCPQKYRSKCFCNSPVGRRSCPNNFCSRFYDLIVLDHDERNPVWTNTDPSCWYSDHWSFARCFLATAGYSNKQSAADTDAAGLLSILINNIEFRASLDNVCNFEKARNTRNDVVHTATFEIEEKELIPVIEHFIELLQDKKALINDASAQQAVSNLEKLKVDEVNICCQKAEELRREAMQAITEKKEEALIVIGQKTLESLQQIADEAKSQTTKVFISTQTQTVENPTTVSDKEKQELQSYLIDLYRKDYLKTDLSPLLPEVEIDVEKVYVPLKMELRRGNSAKTKRVHSLDDVFYCERKQANTVYVSGDAGMGKTTFCRKLISEWCDAHSKSSDISYSISSENTQNKTDTFLSNTSHTESILIYDRSCIMKRKKNDSFDENDSDDDLSDSSCCSGCSSVVSTDEKNSADVNVMTGIFGTPFTDEENSTVMKQFEFLFFVSLRDTNEERSVKDMTINQLLLTKKMRNIFTSLLENKAEKILYILDGLDEWTPPTPLPKQLKVTKGLPVGVYDGNFTTLYTSRPWKVEILRPKLGEHDLDISITGLDKTASKRLVWLIFDKIILEKDEIDTNAVMFLQEIEKFGIECLSSVPLLLKLLICLWEINHELSDSQTGIYNSIISKLCSLAIKRNLDNNDFQRWISQLEEKECKFPPSLKKDTALLKFSALIYALGKISFETLFQRNQSGALVFIDKDLTDLGISEAEYELSLHIGFLSKKKVIGRPRMYPVRCISFIHKTFQEYFAALYISMVFEENEIASQKLKECFKTSETIMAVLKVMTFIKEMCPAVIDRVTKEIHINEKDFKIAKQRNELTLQANLNKNTKLIAELVMSADLRVIVMEFTDLGIHDFRFPVNLTNLEVITLDTVKMTQYTFKQMLENLPETPSGVSLKVCNVDIHDTISRNENFYISLTLNNLKSIEIAYMRMCGIEAQFSKHMKTMNRVKFQEVQMNEKELELLLNSIPETNHDIILIFNDTPLANEINGDSDFLTKTVKMCKNFKEFSFETKYLRGVTFCWSEKKLSCKNIRLSETLKPMEELFTLIESILSGYDLATVVIIETDDFPQETKLPNHDIGLAVIQPDTEMYITLLKLINIKIEDHVFCELLQTEKMNRLRSLQLYNITITQTSNHTQQLALTCEALYIQRGNIFDNISIRFSQAVSSITVESVTMSIKCCLELLSGVKTEHCKLELRNVSFINILHDTLCLESLGRCQTVRAEIENGLNEALVWIIIGSNIDSLALDSIVWTDTCSSGEQIDLIDMYHSKFQVNMQCRQIVKSLYLRRISVPEKCFCSLFDYISSALVRPITPFSVPLGYHLKHEFPQMTEIRLEDLTLTTLSFSVLIGSQYENGDQYKENTLSVFLDNITLIDTLNSYTEVTCKCLRNLTIKRTNLLDLAVIFQYPYGFTFRLQSLVAEIILENVTLTAKALDKMIVSAPKILEKELDDDRNGCKHITRMKISGPECSW